MASFFFFSPCFFMVILMFRARLHALAKFIKKGRKKGRKQATGVLTPQLILFQSKAELLKTENVDCECPLFTPYLKVCIYSVPVVARIKTPYKQNFCLHNSRLQNAGKQNESIISMKFFFPFCKYSAVLVFPRVFQEGVEGGHLGIIMHGYE